ncbi:unnamed protein product [Amoebophrya sp. A120]|nr:unnamed protein product [Amoebophrya sp. A120]|eukprot:GSA120T00013868001.1
MKPNDDDPASSLPAPDKKPSCYRLQPLPNAGIGCVTTKFIPKGTVIIEEIPVITVYGHEFSPEGLKDLDSDRNNDEKEALVEGKFQKLLVDSTRTKIISTAGGTSSSSSCASSYYKDLSRRFNCNLCENDTADEYFPECLTPAEKVKRMYDMFAEEDAGDTDGDAKPHEKSDGAIANENPHDKKSAYGIFLSNAFSFYSDQVLGLGENNNNGTTSNETCHAEQHQPTSKNIFCSKHGNTNNASNNDNSKVTVGLYPLCGKLNHSCSANLDFTHEKLRNVDLEDHYVEEDPEVCHAETRRPDEQQPCYLMRVFTTRDVQPGEELCISYNYEQCFEPRKQRQEFFRSNFRFDCSCEACGNNVTGCREGEVCDAGCEHTATLAAADVQQQENRSNYMTESDRNRRTCREAQRRVIELHNSNALDDEKLLERGVAKEMIELVDEVIFPLLEKEKLLRPEDIRDYGRIAAECCDFYFRGPSEDARADNAGRSRSSKSTVNYKEKLKYAKLGLEAARVMEAKLQDRDDYEEETGPVSVQSWKKMVKAIEYRMKMARRFGGK